jgi:hypothetical protein
VDPAHRAQLALSFSRRSAGSDTDRQRDQRERVRVRESIEDLDLARLAVAMRG